MGFMAITKDVNVHLLNECFELRPFHGLCKPHSNDDLEPPEPLDDIDESEETSSKFHLILFCLVYQTLNSFEIILVPQVKHKLSDGGIIDS